MNKDTSLYEENKSPSPISTSEIISNRMIGIADTTVASVSGQLQDRITGDPLSYANLIFTRLTDSWLYGIPTDTSGNYYITIQPGEYALKASCVRYSTYYDTITLGVGEMRELSIALGRPK